LVRTNRCERGKSIIYAQIGTFNIFGNYGIFKRLQPSSRALIINPEQYLKDLPEDQISEELENTIQSIDIAKAS